MARTIFPQPNSTGAISFSAAPMPPPGTDAGDARQRGSDTPATTQGYLERVQNYIPAEIVAFFIFVNSLLPPELFDSAGQLSRDGYVAIAGFVLGGLFCFIYASVSAKLANNRVWVVQAIMWLIAYLIWVYAMDAKVLEAFEISVVPSLAGLLLVTFAMLSGLVVPGAPADPPEV